MEPLAGDLRARLRERQVVLVVGAGVSIAATDDSRAGWRGLLLNGVEWLGKFVPAVQQATLTRMREQITSGDADEMLAAASVLTSKLSGRASGDYSRWLRESVGALAVRDGSVLDAVLDLGAPIITTNYDGLLASQAGIPFVTWREMPRMQRVLQGDERAIIHIHGHWQHPESVVLGGESYSALITSNAPVVLRAARTMKSLVFIGFGGGVTDPHFASLRAWAAQIFDGAEEYRHFRLFCDEEAAALPRLPATDRVYDICYGKLYSDLVPFLKTCATTVSATAHRSRQKGEIEDLLAAAHDRGIPLSQVLVTCRRYAESCGDVELELFCCTELGSQPPVTVGASIDDVPAHRVIDAYASINRINMHAFNSGDSIMAFVETTPETFTHRRVVYGRPVVEIEGVAADARRTPNGVCYWCAPSGSVLPGNPYPDENLHFYARSSAFPGLLDKIRTRLVEVLLPRVSRGIGRDG